MSKTDRPLLKQARRNVGRERKIDKFSADGGYFSERNVAGAEREKADVCIATGRLKHDERAAPCSRGRPPDEEQTDKPSTPLAGSPMQRHISSVISAGRRRLL